MIKRRLTISSILTVVFTILSVAIGKIGCYYSKTNIDKDVIESVVLTKQAKSVELLGIVKSAVANNEAETLTADVNEIKEHFADQNEIYLAIYKNWHLKLWPSRKVVLPDVFDPDLFSNKVVLLGHSYYLSFHCRINNVDIVVLAHLKTQHKYKNEYLNDEFSKDFNLPNDVRISLNLFSGTRIYDSDKNFLFSVEDLTTTRWSYVLIWISLMIFLLAIAFFFRLIESLVDFLSKSNGLLVAILVSALFAVLARVLMFFTDIPGFLCKGYLFAPELFASGSMFPNLGDSLLNVLWVLFYTTVIYLQVIKQEKEGLKIKVTSYLLVASGIIISLLAFYITSYVSAVVKDSNIELELYKILNINGYTFISLLVLLIGAGSYLLISDLFLTLLRTKYKLKHIALTHLTTLAVITGLMLYFNGESVFAIFFFFLFTTVLYVFHLRKAYGHSFVTVTTALLSVYFVIHAHSEYEEKWHEKNKVVAIQLTSSDDLNTEYQLHEISIAISNDTALQKIVSESMGDFVRTSNYVNSKYFSEINRFYNVSILCFLPSDSVFVDSSSIQWQPWRHHYENRIYKLGSAVPNSDYFRLYRNTGSARYIGFHPIHSSLQQSPTIVIELDDKSYELNRRLHSFLFHDRFGSKTDDLDFSYATYYDNRLISKTGTFDYRTRIISNSGDKDDVFEEQYYDGYKHLIYHVNKNQTVIISEPKVSIYDLIIWFSYVFIIYYVIVLLVSIVFNLSFIRLSLVPTIQNRIQITMAFALLFSIFAIGAGSIYFNFQISQHKHTEVINEKINSVSNEINGQFSKVKDLYRYDEDYMSFLMRKYSRVFNTDVSLFDISGNLVATSLSEIFDEQLIGTKMDYEAYRSLTNDNRSKVIQYENIGNLSYYSAYIPLINSQGVVLGFINLPFLSQDNLKTKDLTSMIVALTNIYVLLLLLSIMLTLFVSNKVTRPLLIVREKLEEFDIKKQNTPIDYDSADEIGDLIKEYNRMVSELAKSTELLAKSERESAWQSMARQVAHEIKNPLTPMKLNIQLLQRAWEDRVYDFDNRLNKVCKTLIEQIDALSNIATEFSVFAKMPQGQYEKLEIYEAVISCVTLFEETKNVKITVETDKKTGLLVIADSDQIKRVFTNLIKNAIQAIPEERLGLINIKLRTGDGNVLISVSDNGMGIPADMQKRMFQPNFTTKTSGMGLGLAMVKNIITGINGNIWYETQQHEGTTFFIQIPLA